MDPLFEKYYGWSPYNYTLGNPLKYVDEEGRNVKLKRDDRNKTVTISADFYLDRSMGESEIRVLNNIFNTYNSHFQKLSGSEILNGYKVLTDFSIVNGTYEESLKNEIGNYVGYTSKQAGTIDSRVLWTYFSNFDDYDRATDLHEFGHLFGLIDRYDAYSGNDKSGFEKDIMGNPENSPAIKLQNFQDIIKRIIQYSNIMNSKTDEILINSNNRER